MKKIKLIVAALAVFAFGTTASAQYWGEEEVTSYIYGGYSSMKSESSINGVHIGIGDLSQINMGNIFWDYNIDISYHFKSATGVKDKAISSKIALDLLYKIDASDDAFVFPFIGIVTRDFWYGKTKVDGVGDVKWFSKNGLDANRYQVGFQAGVHTFIGRFMLRADYELYLTKLVSGAKKMKGFNISVGYRF